MGIHVERSREWSRVEPQVEPRIGPVEEPPRPRRSVVTLPRRRRRRLDPWRVVAVLAVIAAAFAAGRVIVVPAGASAREPAAREPRSWNDTGALVLEVARVKLADRVGTRLVDVFLEGSRVVALYEVGDLTVDLPEPGAGPGTLSFDTEEHDRIRRLDPEKLLEMIDLIEGKLGGDDDCRVECAGGVLVVAASLRTQDKVARLIAALDLRRKD